MELYLQFGYGMMEHSRHLIDRWGGGTVVLSPRDLKDEQLTRLASTIGKLDGGKVLLDPQFYLPHSDHERLCSHDYWPADYQTGAFWQGPALNKLLTDLRELNLSLGCGSFVLPGILAAQIDDDWIEIQRSVLEEAKAIAEDQPLVLTIALSSEAVANQDQVADLLEAAQSWEVAGYYLVCEHPNGDYLVADPNWLANVLDIIAGLRLAGANVIVGYCNHQMLAAAAAGATAVCSGTWMNVRSFPPDKFRSSYDEEIKQRATWCYCPQALSEYKIPFLDIAHRQSLLASMTPSEQMDGGYASQLFTGPQPSTIGLSEQAAFRHYLYALRQQVLQSAQGTFDDTVTMHENLLTDAEALLGRLAAGGVRAQQRDFSQIVDVNRAALAVLSTTRGPMLRRRWPL